MKDPPKAQWVHKTRFPIQDRMADVLRQTLEVSNQQVEVLRKKLRKLQFGS